MPAARLDPYRPLFLMGVGYAIAGALVWVLAAMRLVEYPGLLHRTLMIEGFEQSFIAGFLLTALGGLTHGGRSSTFEMALATVAQLGVGVAAFMGMATAAHGFFLGSMLLLLFAAGLRSRRGRRHGHPPPELIFIVTALLLGVAGAIVLLAGARASDGVLLGLGIRLVAEGEVLTLVVGVGSILVPTFLGHRAPALVTPISKPGGGNRIGLYVVVALLLAGSFGLEMAGLVRLAALARAVGASAVLLAVWRIQRRGPASRLAFTLRAAGFAIMAGLWTVVLLPGRPLLGEHIVFVGGFGLLTMGIGTRVIVSHGAWPPQDETSLLHPVSMLALATSLGFRLAAELVPAYSSALWALSGTLWIVAWLWWAVGAVPRIVVLHRAKSSTP